MLTTTAERIISVLQGGDGRPFTVFVDRLLRANAYVRGVADANVLTNVRTNLADGGVDTQVLVDVGGDTTGLLGCPSVWQYKAMGFSDVTHKKLLDAPYVQERIKAGDAFRLAIADSMPAEKLLEWEKNLWEIAKTLNANAPPVRIVTADRLAELANRFPGLVLTTFQAEVRRDLVHLEAWGIAASDPTIIYVPVGDWSAVQEMLGRHVDFAQKPPSAVRTVQGEAGVGKSRLVYETLKHLPGSPGLVVYTMEDRALDVARSAMNDAHGSVIIVADECSVDTRLQLKKLLDGHAARVRVIAIDNTLMRAHAPDPELALGKMPEPALAAILETNFPQVDTARRRAYVSLAEGFPRLAADLCRWDQQIADQGNVGPVIPHIGEYYRNRLSAEESEAVAALSLVTKIGYAGEVVHELDTLCQFLDLNRRAVQRALERVHDGPGFVGRSGRYMHVTPELVAQVALDDGWRRFAASDPQAFLARFPTGLLDSFLDRVWRSAAEEVRRECAEYFRSWADARQPADLTDLETVRRLVTLTDTHPDEYMPLVRRLIETASIEELRGVTGASTGFGGWGPRRSLVWLAERFAQLPDHWDDAERILAALASGESEPGIANNATAIWGQGFRIFLSGTSTPFGERLDRFRDRLFDQRPAVREVARSVIRELLEGRVTRTMSSAVVAGRIPPPEWHPRTHREAHHCLEAALAYLAEWVTIDEETRGAVIHAVLEEFRHLIGIGHAAEVRRIFEAISLNDDERARLIDALDMVLEYDRPGSASERGDDESQDSDDAEDSADVEGAEIAAWRNSLVGTDMHSRVLALVSKDQWRSVRLRHEDEWRSSLRALARDLVQDPAQLAQEIPWLLTPAARAAADLGNELGVVDADGALFDQLMNLASPGESGLLARGYGRGLAASHPTQQQRLNSWLDSQEPESPEVAADIAISAGAVADPLARVIRLFDKGLIPSHYLYARNFPADGTGELSAGALVDLLTRLAGAAEAGDQRALHIGLDNLAFRLPYHAPEAPDPLLAANPELLTLAWRLLDAVPEDSAPSSHWWDALLVHLSRFDPARVARYSARQLTISSLAHEDGLTRVITAVAKHHPTLIMDAVGEVMLSDTAGYRFFIGDYQDLFDSIPDDVKRQWIQKVGVEGARRIARHLKSPVIDDGRAVVPDFTAWVLTEFEDDDRTFSEFAAGTHSWKMYRGDIAAEHEAEAEVARAFLDHPLARVRQWAVLEERAARAEAKAERQRQAERDLP